ncbi:MAG: lytic transglycosylase domain-containing protein [Sphingorhabdus sp.]
MGYIVVRSALDKEAGHNMSSMVKHLISASVITLSLMATSAVSQTVVWQPGVGPGPAASAPNALPTFDPSDGNIPAALQRWRMLSASGNYAFSEYASFLMSYPDWPDSDAMRQNAEQSINVLNWSPNQAVAFFDRLPPLTNAGRAKYALALAANGDKVRAEAVAREAWRAGPLTDDDEGRLQQMMGGRLSAADHDARVDRLLWSGATRSAERILPLTSAIRRPAFAAALAMKTKNPNASTALQVAGRSAETESTLIAERVNQLKIAGDNYGAREVLVNRGDLVTPPPVIKDWYKLLLANAEAARNDGQYEIAYRIASRVDDSIPVGMDMMAQDLTTRDRYTSLMWMAGTIAMERLGRPGDAVGMFTRYAAAAKSPQTRSKGLYWAGKASSKSGDQRGANRFYNEAATYYDSFFGQLSLEQLNKPLPPVPGVQITPNVAPAESQPPVYLAAALAAKYGSWKDQSNFLRTISKNAKTPEDFVGAVSLSKKINRPDLAVMAGRNARYFGYANLVGIGYPTVNVPASHNSNWTLIHAIARQESQFDKAIVSHAGARGLMQLMPGTARETSGKIAMAYRPDALTVDTDYNIQLGSTYIQRMLDYYGGSYPLAIAAYNGGPGNVNKWLKANGDPRTGAIDIMEWIEKIPLSETRDYVYRVLENAVMYDHMHPEKARIRSTHPLSTYLGKSRPG